MEWDHPEFRGSRFLPGGHLQTIAANFLPAGADPGVTVQHVVPASDGDSLVLHETAPRITQGALCDVLMLHGVGGSHANPYMVRATRVLADSGFRVWRMDQRGCGAGIRLARHHAHAGRTEDVQAIVSWFAARHAAVSPGKSGARPRLILVSFSLGANLALRWLALQDGGRHPLIDSVIAIAPPVDLIATSGSLRRGVGRFYDMFFASILRQRLVERRRVRPDMTDTGVHPVPTRLERFDEAFTAPLAGFASALEYYRHSSAGEHLRKIETPTLIVYDRNDPVVPIDRVTAFAMGPGIHVVETRGGGHMGYFARRGLPQGRRWMEWRIRDWVAERGLEPRAARVRPK